MSGERLVFGALSAVLAGGCVAPSPNEGVPGPSTASPAAHPAPAIAGGALRLDQISVVLPLGALELRVTPLDERVIRHAAPDIRPRLRRLSTGSEEESVGESESRLLVTFTSQTPDQEFLPADVRFEVGGMRMETLAIVPVTAGWGSQRLRVREPESAVYILRGRFDPYSSLRVLYGPAASDGWREVIPVLRAEERRVD